MPESVLICDRRGGVFGVLGGGEELAEKAAYDLYFAHVRDCLACDPGASYLCTLGGKLERRWAVAQRVQGAGEVVR